MTKEERLILKNQYAILELLSRAHPKLTVHGNTVYHDPDTYGWYQDVLSYGHETLIREAMQDVYENELSEEQQKDVIDILDMWNELQSSYNHLTDKEDLTDDDVKFRGWNANGNELAFAKLYCFRGRRYDSPTEDEKPARFENIKPSPAFSSSFPTDAYMRMLAVYLPIKRARMNIHGLFLTLTDIKNILRSLEYPE